jgi:hypothetical protein
LAARLPEGLRLQIRVSDPQWTTARVADVHNYESPPWQKSLYKIQLLQKTFANQNPQQKRGSTNGAKIDFCNSAAERYVDAERV